MVIVDTVHRDDDPIEKSASFGPEAPVYSNN